MYRPTSNYASFFLAGLFLLAIIAYMPGISGPFLFDDGPALTSNPYLRIDGTAFDDWRVAALSSNSGPLRRPLAMFSFTLNQVASGGISVFPVKIVNVGIHLACGGLVYLLALLILRTAVASTSEVRIRQFALLAAALWTLAPLHVSTVLYAVQRMAQLATFFVLTGMVLFVYRRERWAQQGASLGEILSTGLWLLLLLLLAVLSKENGIALLWLLTVAEVTLYRGRWAGKDLPWLRLLGWVAFFMPLILVALILVASPNALIGGYARREFSLEERLLTQLRLLWHYLYWLLMPNVDAMGFQHDDISISTGWTAPATTALAAVGWMAALSISALAAKKFPLLLFALLFYLTGHFFESGLWPLEMVYEHRNYLPSVGVYILAAYLILSLTSLQSVVRERVVVFAIVASIATLLFLRVHVWGDPLRLSSVNVKNHPNSSRSHYFQAEAFLDAYQAAREDGTDELTRSRYLLFARHHFERMYQLNPRDIAALVMLHYMDSHHFPELGVYNDWFAKLEEVASDRSLQASDYSALETLTDCFLADACGASPERFFMLLDSLELRYPQSVNFALMKYRYLKGMDAPVEQRLQLLKEAGDRQPADRKVLQYQIVEHAEAGDLSETFGVTLSWLHHDPKRRDLRLIRDLFAPDKAQMDKPASKVAPGEEGI